MTAIEPAAFQSRALQPVHAPEFADVQFIPAEPRQNGLNELFALIWRRKLLFSVVFLSVLAVSAVQIAFLAREYTASAMMYLDPRETHYADLPSVVSAAPQTSDLSLDLVQSEMEVLRSPGLARRVILALGLQDDPAFMKPTGWLFDRLIPAHGPPPTPAAKLEAAEQRYSKDLSLFNDGKSFVISMRFTTGTPQLARRVISEQVNLYLADQRAFKQQAIARAERWLGPEVARLAAQLQQSEAELQGYRNSNHLTRTDGETIAGRQLSDLTAQLAAARSNLALKVAREQELQDGQIDTEQLGSQTLSHLREQEATISARLAGLQVRYGSRSPLLGATTSSLASVQRRIAAELGRMRTAADNDVAIARRSAARLQTQVTELEQQVGTTRDAELAAAAKQRDVDAERKLYDNLLGRYQQVRAQYSIQQADTRVVSAPLATLQPSFPRRGLLAAIAAVAAALVAGLAVMLLEQFRGEARTLGDVERSVGAPGLGSVPRLRGFRKRPWPPVLEPLTQPAAAMQALANSIRFQSGGTMPRMIAVASALPRDGKTTVAALLACSLAQSGARVLLVDADLRRRGLSRRMEMSRDFGLVRLLQRGGALQDAVVHDRRTGIDVLAAERNCSNPYRLLGGGGLPAMLAQARENYDTVVMDTTPLAAVDDALPFAVAAESTILVAACGSTPVAALRGALHRLRLAGARNVGVALNRVARRGHAYQPGMESVGTLPRLYFGGHG